jgi:C1A family cysteine protease
MQSSCFSKSGQQPAVPANEKPLSHRRGAGVLYALGMTGLLLVGLAGCQSDTDPTKLTSLASRVNRQLGLARTPASRLSRIRLADRRTGNTTLPASFSLTMPPVEPNGQGAESSCVAWATAYAARSFLQKTTYTTSNGSVNYGTVFSPEYVYNQVKSSADCQSGSYFVSPNDNQLGALDLLQQQGVCLWQAQPYTDRSCGTQPTSAQRTEAAPYKISRYERVSGFSTDDLKRLLVGQSPIVIGATVDEGFADADARFVWASRQGQNLGGHALVIVGYDNTRQAFKLMNSWGTGWGDAGYSWLAYSYYDQVVFEAYLLYN